MLHISLPGGSHWPVGLVVAVVVVDLAFRLAAVAVVPANRQPSSAMAWLLAILLIPYAGLLAFVLIGSPKLPRRRREAQSRASAWIAARATTEQPRAALAPPEAAVAPWLASLARMNRELGALPVVAGTSARLVSDTRQAIDAIVAAVDAAERFVHAEYYILALDATTEPFFDALARAVARGVRVRVLLDHLASHGCPSYRATLARLDRDGVAWRRMLPLWPTSRELLRPDLRNHRKILVVDDAVAFTGSLNLIDPGYDKRSNARRGLQWVDVVVRFDGPLAEALNALFLTDWYSETGDRLEDEVRSVAALRARTGAPAGDLHGQVVPSGPGFPEQNNLKLFTALLHAAQRDVVVVSPYFVPDEALLVAITSAAERGLRVELFVSEIGDQWLVHHAQCSYYEQLLRAGVRIWLYPAPYVLHTKTVSIDDEVAVIGSSNMDMRSFTLNLEVSVLVRGASLVAQLRALEDDYRQRSRELLLQPWLARPFLTKYGDGIARLASALV